MTNRKENIGFLLDYCSKIPELYNEVSNHLYDRFGIISAEATLIVTYYVSEERRKTIRANIETEISSLECKIEQKHEEIMKLFILIMKLSDRHDKLIEDVDDMVYKLKELREQLEE